MKRTFAHKWRGVLSLLALLMLVPMAARADQVYYKEANGTVSSCDAQKITADTRKIEGNYYVSDVVSIPAPLTVSGMARIILMDGGGLHALGCIVVEDDASLTITTGNTSSTITGNGALYAIDTYNGDGSGNNDNDGDDARIGSREGNKCGTIIINGGQIHTYSTYSGTYSIYGADIGSGYKGNGGKITINGGNVWCRAGHENDVNSMCAATIGSGYKTSGNGIIININDGVVKVWGTGNKKNWGAGIGTGQSAEASATINIKGGNVTAYSSTNYVAEGAGIGTGDDYSTDTHTTIDISGGDVYAYSCGNGDDEKGYGAGIGAGDDSFGTVDINITGGTVMGVSGYWRGFGSGIGGGENGGAGTITIGGTANVKAYNCAPHNEPKGAGIGNGESEYRCTLTVDCSKCVLDTWGLYGIGGGEDIPLTGQATANNRIIKVESGESTYGVNNDNSPQYYDSKVEKIQYGTSKWRRISSIYSVTYNPNGGNGDVEADTIGGDEVAIVRDNLFTYDNRVFVGWNTQSDGSGTWYNPGDTVDSNDNVTLYAQWKSNKSFYYLTAKGDTALVTPEQFSVVNNATLTLTNGIWVVQDDPDLRGRLTVSGDNVTLVLIDGIQLDASELGIEVAAGNALTITAGNTTSSIAGTGSLIAVGDQYNAAIGGSVGVAGGAVNIIGGKVEATGVDASAIGGGNSGTAGTLTIGHMADVIVQSNTSGCYSLYCTTATATPDQNWAVWVQDKDGNNLQGTPSTSQVDLINMGLASTYQYAHIFMAKKAPYVITYDANGGSGTTAQQSAIVLDTVVVSDNQFTNGNLYFNGWNTAADGSGTWYDEGAEAVFIGNTTLYAQWIDQAVYYINAKGDTVATKPHFTSQVTDQTRALSSGIWMVKDSVKVKDRLTVNNENVTLILLDGAHLDVSATFLENLGGIDVEAGGTLTITAGNTTRNIAGTGSLIATSNGQRAAIGSGNAIYVSYPPNGTINIMGGKIVARGGTYSTAIGGSQGAAGGTVNIMGGKVEAYAGSDASAIGAGNGSTEGIIRIGGTADVIAHSSTGGCFAVNGSIATATPNEGYVMFVHDADAHDVPGTPSTTQVDLNAIGLGDTYQYAHIFSTLKGTPYSVTYNANGGSGTSTPTSATVGEQVVISNNPFTNGDLGFSGWNTAADGSGTWYNEGDSVTFYSDTTLYAVWTDHFIYYITRNGDTATIAPQRCNVVTTNTQTLTRGIWIVQDSVSINTRLLMGANDVTLILMDGGHLNAATDGIEVEVGNTLTITAGNTTQNIAGSGTLYAYTNIYGTAAIGTRTTEAGTVNIMGGRVTAYADQKCSSAIGGGSKSDGGKPGKLYIGGIADVIVENCNVSVGTLNCTEALATPSKGYVVKVLDNTGNDVEGTPSASQVDLNAIGLGNQYMYAHIFMAKSCAYNVGDVNHDGIVNVDDATALVAMILGNGEGCSVCADVNYDGIINVDDVTALIAMILGNS